MIARLLAAALLLVSASVFAQSGLEMFYLGAPDCPYCGHWEGRAKGELLASPEGKAVRYIEIKGETLRQPIEARHYPPEHAWLYHRIGPSRGVPRFVLAEDGTILANAYGTEAYHRNFLPALRQAVARRAALTTANR